MRPTAFQGSLPFFAQKSNTRKNTFSFSWFLGLVLLFLLLWGVGLPVYSLIRQSAVDGQGNFVFTQYFFDYLQTPGLLLALQHTLVLGVSVSVTVTFFAFLLAYALTHARIPGKKLIQLTLFFPLFTPSLFPALGIIYLLGKKGIISNFFGTSPCYGAVGIFLGACVYTLPHAFLLLLSALREVDSNLYLAAKTLGASQLRRFFTVTMPAVRYNMISSFIVVFILTITDFGIPKILGGNYNVLATEIYVQAIGMHNFPLASITSLVLMIPAFGAFFLDRWAKKKQFAIPQSPPIPSHASPFRDAIFTVICYSIALIPASVVGIVLLGAFYEFWPYNLELSFINFAFEEALYGVSPFWNSLSLALWTACIGTTVIAGGAYLTQCADLPLFLSAPYQLFAMLPLCIPGTVLGLSYILCFSGSFFEAILGNKSIMVLNCLIHFYTVCHLNVSGAIARMPKHYENTGKTLGVPVRITLMKVIIPLQKRILMDIWLYLFISTLTTISALVFLYTPETIPASVSLLQMYDDGQMGESAAMGTLIFLAALTAKIFHECICRHLKKA